VPTLIKILILAAFFNGLSWIILIPIWQYPDEQSHFAQIQDIAELGYTPKVGPNTSLEIAISERLLDTQRDGLGNNKFTYNPYYHIDYARSQEGLYENFISNLPRETKLTMAKREATENPPLYQIMSANFYRLFGEGNLFDRVYAVRFFSVILYVILVVTTVNASSLIFNKDNALKAVLPGVVAFTPMLVFSTTGVLPDPLTILLFSAIFAVCLKIIRKGFSAPLIVLLAILNFLGIYTRQQFQIALPISLTAVVYALYEITPQNRKAFFWLFLGFFVLLSILAIMLRPAFLAIPEVGVPNFALIFTGQFIIYLTTTIKHYYSQTLPWYWGVYKWLSLTLPHVYYQLINRLVAFSFVGITIWVISMIRKQKFDKDDLVMAFFITSIFIYFSIFIVWDFYFQRQYNYTFGIQGRYFLPLVLPITTVLVFGIKNVLRPFIKKYLYMIYFFIAFAIILFNDISLSFVASTYVESSNLKTFVNQVSQYKPVVFKGNTIILMITLALLLQAFYLFKLLESLRKDHEGL